MVTDSGSTGGRMVVVVKINVLGGGMVHERKWQVTRVHASMVSVVDSWWWRVGMEVINVSSDKSERK